MGVWGEVLAGRPVSAEELAGERTLNDLAGCPQTPEFHGEGDVAQHTSLVLDVAEDVLSQWGGAGPGPVERTVLRLAALLHDVGKPATTVEVAPCRFSAKGHAEEGARIVNTLMDVVPELSALPLGVEAAVHALVRDHMWTYHVEGVSPGAMVRMTHLVDPRLLLALWTSDTRGRVCSDAAALAEQVEYAALTLAEHRCDRPDTLGVLADARSEEEWAGLPARVRREALRALVSGRVGDAGSAGALVSRSERHGEGRGSLTYTIGLPGAGKSTWSRRWQERTDGVVLSSEGRRRRDRRAARTAALEELPGLLRDGVDVVVDATHVRRESRDLLLATAERYGSQVHAVYVRSRLGLALSRQDTRPWDAAVPGEAVRRMRRDLRLPTPDEYDTLTVVEEDGETWAYTPQTRYLTAAERTTLRRSRSLPTTPHTT